MTDEQVATLWTAYKAILNLDPNIGDDAFYAVTEKAGNELLSLLPTTADIEPIEECDTVRCLTTHRARKAQDVG